MKLEIGRLFFLITLAMTTWLLGDTLMNSSQTSEAALQWTKLSSSGAALIGPPLVWFVITSGYPRLLTKKYILIILCSISAVFGYITLASNLVAAGALKTYWGYYMLPGFLYTPLSLYVSLSALTAVGLALYARNHLQRQQKNQMTVFILAFGFPLIGGLISEVIFPLLNQVVPPLTSALFSFSGVFIAYAIFKYEFLAISPALAFERIFNTMKDALIVADQNGEIILFNDATMNMTGYLKDELLNRSLDQLLTDKDMQQIDFKYFQNKSLDNERMNFIHKTNLTPTKIQISSKPFVTQTGSAQGLVLVAHDISAREELIEHLEKKTFELESSKKILEKTMEEVQRLNTTMVGREVKMVELKNRIRELENRQK
jgi:PAS domain S-box-containing protein